MIWQEPSSVSVPADLAAAVGGHPLIAETLVRRGFTTPDSARAFLDPAAYTPAPPEALPGLARAVERLEAAIHQGEQICVWGDFDVDGQTATALLVQTLTDLGGQATYHIPVRAAESHGVSLPALQKVLAAGARLILTCDTGIAAAEAVTYSQAQGADVIVTDHHDLPQVLPPARAVVSPKLLPPTHPLADLPGVGVAYKLAEALQRRAGRPEAAAQGLDLVSLGTIADLALLRADTRYLAQRGLISLRQTGRLGLRALMETAGIAPASLTEEHIAFVLAPRLNAAGRLADANPVVELLTTGDLSRARILAADLEALNGRRKLMCDQVYAAAEAQLSRDRSLGEGAALVLASPSWPAGVIGIVAARLVERYGKPAVLIAAPPGELARGSARSVPGCNITAALAAHADLLAGYGGHAMAAGFSLAPERIPELRRALSREIGDLAVAGLPDVEEPGHGAVRLDGYLSLADLTLDLVADLERLAPFGPGNPPLVLASRGLRVQSRRAVGRSDEHVLVTVADETGATRQVIRWDAGGEPLADGQFDLAYVARASDFRGQRNVQLEWIEARRPETDAVAIAAAPAIEVVDCRRSVRSRSDRRDADRRHALERLIGEQAGEVAVWREAGARRSGARPDIPSHDRFGLPPASILAIWTTPPGPAELRDVLARVSPGKVYLFGVDPGFDSLNAFAARLAGLVKHALSTYGGAVAVKALAAATAQREATVRLGIAWLAARGHVAILGDDRAQGPMLQLGQGDGQPSPELAQATSRLEAALAETSAYRIYFAQADKDRLVQGSPS